MLEIRGLRASYGAGEVLRGVDLDVPAGEVTALLGRNGMGKSTLLAAVIGWLRPSAGEVRLDGARLTGARPHVVARAGVALVPQGRRIFAPLTVEEHLRIAARGPGDWTVPAVYDLLPRLAERRRHRGNELSGGEQQMLAIARALVCNPRVLLLDEPAEGLAPAAVDQIGDIVRTLRNQRQGVLLVEQNLALALPLADHVAVLEKGRVVHDGDAAAFRGSPELAERLLGVGAEGGHR